MHIGKTLCQKKIIPVTLEDQAKFLDQKDKAIPQVVRNKETGWPLFQVGIFYPVKNDKLEGCVFRPHPNSDSSLSRTLIPISPEHSFHF